MKAPKRPIALMTAAQIICLLALVVTLLLSLLPTLILFSAQQQAANYGSSFPADMRAIGLCARDLLLGLCLVSAEAEALGIFSRVKKASAFCATNEKALGRISLALILSGLVTLLFGNALVPFLLQGLPAIHPAAEWLLMPFLLMGIALMIRAVQVLTHRAVSLQEENNLTV